MKTTARILSFLLALILLCTTALTGCTYSVPPSVPPVPPPDNTPPEEEWDTVEDMAQEFESELESWLESTQPPDPEPDLDPETETETEAETEPPLPPEPPRPTLALPEGTDLNILSYTYASVAADLVAYGYDVFNAVAHTDRGTDFGLAYCDYNEAYALPGDSKTYLSTGFFGMFADETVSTSESAVYVSPLNREADEIHDSIYGYVVAFSEEGLPDGHFVASGKYVIYSVSEGTVDIDVRDNLPHNYDLSLGKLYDYDSGEPIYIPLADISSAPIGYVPLTEAIDTQAVKSNLYSVIEEQEKNGYRLESLTVAYISLDTLNALSGVLTQTDTLNGFSFDALNRIDYDGSSQYLHFNADGSISVKDFPPFPSLTSKSFTDWLVDGLVLTGGAAIAVVSLVFMGPSGGVIAGAVIGAGVEYFMQTAIEGKTFAEVNWNKVGILAISGAVGAMVPCAGTMGFIAAGAVGGITDAALTAVDGGSFEDILHSAGEGALISLVTHGLFSMCFPEKTPVLTRDGWLPIEAVTAGMLVASCNTATMQTEWRPVLETYVNETLTLTHVHLSDGSTIRSTPSHPYFVPDSGCYIAAEELSVGDRLYRIDGQPVTVTAVETQALDQPLRVYNFNVGENHNYFVDSGILVHNSCVGEIGSYKSLQKAATIGDGIEAHHMPSKAFMKQWGISADDAYALNISKAAHIKTFTYGHAADRQSYYMSLSPNEALALDMSNLRAIYRQEGTLDEMLPILQKYVEVVKQKFPNLFY